MDVRTTLVNIVITAGGVWIGLVDQNLNKIGVVNDLYSQSTVRTVIIFAWNFTADHDCELAW